MFPGKECVVNCQSELPKLSESYSSHLPVLVELTIVTCLKSVKGHKRRFFTCMKLRKVTCKFVELYVDAKTYFMTYKSFITPWKITSSLTVTCHLI